MDYQKQKEESRPIDEPVVKDVSVDEVMQRIEKLEAKTHQLELTVARLKKQARGKRSAR